METSNKKPSERVYSRGKEDFKLGTLHKKRCLAFDGNGEGAKKIRDTSLAVLLDDGQTNSAATIGDYSQSRREQ